MATICYEYIHHLQKFFPVFFITIIFVIKHLTYDLAS